MYMMRALTVQHRQRRSANNVTVQLNELPEVTWAQQQRANIRVKRDFFNDNGNSIRESFEHMFQSLSLPRENSESPPFQRTFQKRSFESFIKNIFNDFGRSILLKVLKSNESETIDKRAIYNDELWPHQWYIAHDGLQKYDHGIMRAWDMGFTGRGVVVTVLDDGLEWRHSDLKNNYDHNASFDVNDNDDDPSKISSIKVHRFFSKYFT